MLLHLLLVLIKVFSEQKSRLEFFRSFLHFFGCLAAIFVIGFLVIYPIYQYHTLNYPPEKQVSDSRFLLSTFGFKPAADLVIFLADKPVIRAYSQYFLGLLMVFQRASFGHTTYFMGEVSASGWKIYFPFVYLIKETLSFHLLTLISVITALCALIASHRKNSFLKEPLNRLRDWLKNHLAETAMLLFIAIYWATSLKSNLNIGVRHLLPTIPLVIVLVSGTIWQWLANNRFQRLKTLLVAVLIAWQAISIFRVYPYFLAYANELVGGPDKLYNYTVDSNLDWGQDLKRLSQWLEKNEISKVYVDYFGGSNINYYLGEKAIPWQETNKAKDFPKGNYLAVSATLLQAGRGKLAPGSKEQSGYYLWLNQYQPIAKIGYSIFIYYID